MTEVKYITINNIDFIIVSELDFNGNHYMIALDEKNENSLAVLKHIIENGEERAISVDDDDEFEMVIELFKRKNNC